MPPTEKYALVDTASAGSNHTPPGPDFLVQRVRSAAGAGLPSSETVAVSSRGAGSVTAAIAAIAASETVGAVLAVSSTTRVTVTSSDIEAPRSEIVRRKTYSPATGNVTDVSAASGWRMTAPSPPSGAETSDHAVVPAYPLRNVPSA